MLGSFSISPVKLKSELPIRYSFFFMSIAGLIIRSFITSDIMISGLSSAIIATICHFFVVSYIQFYVLTSEKKLEKIRQFIRKHRQDPE